MTDELFTVEHEDGETIDIQGDGGFSVFYTRAEAQDALDSEVVAIGDSEVSAGMRVIRFVREAVTEKTAEPAREWRYLSPVFGESTITTDESIARNVARMYGDPLQSRTPATGSQPAGEWVEVDEP